MNKQAPYRIKPYLCLCNLTESFVLDVFYVVNFEVSNPVIESEWTFLMEQVSLLLATGEQVNFPLYEVLWWGCYNNKSFKLALGK